MYDISRFTLAEMTSLSSRLRRMGGNDLPMESVAGEIVSTIYRSFTQGEGGPPACALVRFFKTHPYGGLTPDLQAFARRMTSRSDIPDDTQCLTLLATIGERPDWCSRRASVGHQAIPLVTPEIVVKAPMISNMICQMGLDVNMLLKPNPAYLIDVDQKAFNVFYVAEALGSSVIHAQEDFVHPFGIRSVLGIGGVLPSGNIYALIMFSKMPIPRLSAELFNPLALSVKIALLASDRNVFAGVAT